MAAHSKPKIGIVWRGPAESRGTPVPQSARLYPVFMALEARGLTAEPAIYSEEVAEEFRAQLLACDGVLVWVDPLDAGKTRAELDTILRHVASRGVWVSAHPDVTLKMGTKQVLVDTRHLGWGTDTVLYRTFDEFAREFPSRLETSGPRVLKQYRGNGGQGVWKVALMASRTDVRLQEATHRDGTASEMKLGAFVSACETYFAGDSRIIDQMFQPRITEGMIRCYMSGGALVGFARQYPKGYAEGRPSQDIFGIPAEKTMYGPGEPQFQPLRAKLEREWTPQMQQALGLDDASLPALWDADFLFGPKTSDGEDTFVLCEINVSCVTPFPQEAPARIAATVLRALATRDQHSTHLSRTDTFQA